MEMTGEQRVPLGQVATWEALNDPDVLKDCIPGCESIERLGANEFAVTMTAKVGPVQARFRGKMTLAEADPPRSYTLLFEGQGGTAGFARGKAAVTLSEDGTGTRLAYWAQATVGGKLAQVGARLIHGVAKKMAEQFFSAFNHRVSAKS